MKNLFDRAVAAEFQARLANLHAASPRQWGKMTPAQTAAHCSIALETALGEHKPPRLFIGRVLGPVIKRAALGNERPMRPNSPTAPSFIVSDDRQIDVEKEKLRQLIDRFSKEGPQTCTDHPHAFFGKLTPDQWSELMVKHLDHHLRQFGV